MTKYILSTMLLLFSFTCFSQSVKDSLLAKDYKVVEEQLTIMHYLDHLAVKYNDNRSETRKTTKDANFINYYNSVIVANNPVQTLTISEYLGYTNDEVPNNAAEFIDRVAEKNVHSLISIIETYGYPSAKRIAVTMEEKENLMATIFVSRTNKGDDRLKKLIKPELKNGNISEKEYDTLRFFISNRD